MLARTVPAPPHPLKQTLPLAAVLALVPALWGVQTFQAWADPLNAPLTLARGYLSWVVVAFVAVTAAAVIRGMASMVRSPGALSRPAVEGTLSGRGAQPVANAAAWASAVATVLLWRFRADPASGLPMMAWAALLLACGMLIMQRAFGPHALRPYWLVATLVIVRWTLAPPTPWHP